MLKYELQNAADKLIKDIFHVHTEETVAITADTCSDMDVVDSIASSVVAAGGKPLVMINKTANGIGQVADPDLPIDSLAGALSNCDVWIECNHSWLLYSTPYVIATRDNSKLRYMCLVDFEPGVFHRVIGQVEIEPLKEFMLAAKEVHLVAKNVRVTTPAGTDVSFEMDHNHFLATDYGDASLPGIHMVPGQFNIVPKFGSVNGKIVFDGTITPPFSRIPDQPVKLTIENGIITDVNGGMDAKAYYKWLKDFDDPGMFKMAHIAYGFNTGAMLTGNVVEDERIWGCTEWGIGFVSPSDAPPTGQNAISHSDGICLNSSIYLDGVPFMIEGNVVHEEVKHLALK